MAKIYSLIKNGIRKDFTEEGLKKYLAKGAPMGNQNARKDGTKSGEGAKAKEAEEASWAKDRAWDLKGEGMSRDEILEAIGEEFGNLPPHIYNAALSGIRAGKK